MKTWTNKQAIVAELKDQIANYSDVALRALMRVYANQTADEQYSATVEEYNGIGFVGLDAEILTSFAKQYETRGSLSPKQMAIVFKKMPKYAGQLIREAIANGLYVKEGKTWIIAPKPAEEVA